MAKWFISENDEVRGPFTDAQVQAQVDAKILSSHCLIWTKGMMNWKNAQQWESALKNQPMTPQQIQQQRLWHYAIDSHSHGPIPYPTLISELSKYGDRANEVQLWTKGMKGWEPLFHFHEIMDELGVNRRQNPRAPIEGQVVIKLGETSQMIGALRSISQGGFGADRLQGLLPGQQVSVEIRSKALFEGLIVRAEVRYLGENGYVGFLFTTINHESTAAIIQYVKGQTKTRSAA